MVAYEPEVGSQQTMNLLAPSGLKNCEKYTSVVNKAASLWYFVYQPKQTKIRSLTVSSFLWTKKQEKRAGAGEKNDVTKKSKQT